MRDLAKREYCWGLYSLGSIVEGRAFKNRALIDNAARLYHRAANQGVAAAYVKLSLFYKQGKGSLPQQNDLSLRYLKMAANMHHAEACYTLFQVYFGGLLDVAKDVPQATKWLRLAADLGHQEAIMDIACIPSEGVDGINPDPSEGWSLILAQQNPKIIQKGFYRGVTLPCEGSDNKRLKLKSILDNIKERYSQICAIHDALNVSSDVDRSLTENAHAADMAMFYKPLLQVVEDNISFIAALVQPGILINVLCPRSDTLLSPALTNDDQKISYDVIYHLACPYQMLTLGADNVIIVANMLKFASKQTDAWRNAESALCYLKDIQSKRSVFHLADSADLESRYAYVKAMIVEAESGAPTLLGLEQLWRRERKILQKIKENDALIIEDGIEAGRLIALNNLPEMLSEVIVDHVALRNKAFLQSNPWMDELPTH